MLISIYDNNIAGELYILVSFVSKLINGNHLVTNVMPYLYYMDQIST